MPRAGNKLVTAEKRIWSAQVLGKYWLLQLPEAALVVVVLLLLQEWLQFPPWLTWSLAGLWVAKDAALYPFVWRSFDPGYPATLHSLDGEDGVATERLDPSGYIRVRGELWRAELARGARPVDKDEPVRVQAMRGLTVIVVAAGDLREH
jgi:membrane protein implicated in regulation of membrane protease activity